MDTSGNIAAVLAVVLACLAALAAPAAATPGGTGVVAVFEGNEIDLASGWGDATACLDRGAAEVVECFSTENELLERVAEIDKGSAATSSWCSGYLALYDGTNYTGSVLYLRDRYQWINLSGYGFSNRTSSFTVSACPAIFADGNYGAGDHYPTSQTEAWDQSPSMLSGWDNRVSSIYLG